MSQLRSAHRRSWNQADRVRRAEPYAKSRATELHDDAITLDDAAVDDGPNGKVKFLPFIGVAARRYVDLFSMKLSSGTPAVRQVDGIAFDWMGSEPVPRFGPVPASYIEQEKLFVTELGKFRLKSGGSAVVQRKISDQASKEYWLGGQVD